MKIPAEVVDMLEQASVGVVHGVVALNLYVKDGHARYEIVRKTSYIPDDKLGLKNTFYQAPDRNNPTIHRYALGFFNYWK